MIMAMHNLGSTKTELELKFLVRYGMGGKSAQKKLYRKLKDFGFSSGKQGQQSIDDVYFDTGNRDLEQVGWSLRRRNTSGQTTLTLKSGAATAATFKRRETEYTYNNKRADTESDISIPAESRISNQLQSLGIAAADLEPVHQQHSQRRLFELTHPSDKTTSIEWAVDRVSSAQLTNGYVEFEFELLEGHETLLHHVNLIARGEKYLHPSRMAKLRRGVYAPYPDRQPSLQAKSVIETAERHWRKHAVITLQECADTLLAHEPFAFEAVHPEGVHQLRIATRRTRAALDLFSDVMPPSGDAVLQPELKRLTRALGKVRDLDVHHAQLASNFSRGKWPAYKKFLCRQQAKRQRQLQQTLTEDFYTLHSHLLNVIQQIHSSRDAETHSVREHLAHVLPTAIADMLDTGIQLHKFSNADDIHTVRIALKKLRYQLDTFAGVNADIDRLTEAAKKLQSLLGDYQDTELARAMIRKFPADKSGRKNSSLDKFYQKQQRRADKLREPLAQAWLIFYQDCCAFRDSPQALTGISQ